MCLADAGKEDMSVKEFAEKIRNAVQKKLGKDYYVEVRKNLKLNSTKLWSVNIHSSNEKITPIIYLESFYADYEEGKTLGEVVEEIIKFYFDNSRSIDYDFNKLSDIEYARDKICLKLCNRESNREMLRNTIYREFLDLAVYFYIELEDCPIGYGHITIKKEYLDMWGIGREELYELALKNTCKRYPVKIQSLNECVRLLMNSNRYKEGEIPLQENDSYEDIYMPEEIGSCMWVASNDNNTYGSSVILYPDVLKEFAERLGSNLFVIPSSIHECIIISDPAVTTVNGAGNGLSEEARNLKKIIESVNNEAVKPSEILSYNLYYFDTRKKELEVI